MFSDILIISTYSKILFIVVVFFLTTNQGMLSLSLRSGFRSCVRSIYCARCLYIIILCFIIKAAFIQGLFYNLLYLPSFFFILYRLSLHFYAWLAWSKTKRQRAAFLAGCFVPLTSVTLLLVLCCITCDLFSGHSYRLSPSPIILPYSDLY